MCGAAQPQPPPFSQPAAQPEPPAQLEQPGAAWLVPPLLRHQQAQHLFSGKHPPLLRDVEALPGRCHRLGHRVCSDAWQVGPAHQVSQLQVVVVVCSRAGRKGRIGRQAGGQASRWAGKQVGRQAGGRCCWTQRGQLPRGLVPTMPAAANAGAAAAAVQQCSGAAAGTVGALRAHELTAHEGAVCWRCAKALHEVHGRFVLQKRRAGERAGAQACSSRGGEDQR